jgi:hypothetical protein
MRESSIRPEHFQPRERIVDVCTKLFRRLGRRSLNHLTANSLCRFSLHQQISANRDSRHRDQRDEDHWQRGGHMRRADWQQAPVRRGALSVDDANQPFLCGAGKQLAGAVEHHPARQPAAAMRRRTVGGI